jgi:putative hydrolase of the HAD superfamily
VDGATAVLDFLLTKGDELILYTKGCKPVQKKKIEVNNLHQWFEASDIHIVPDKSANDLEKIIGCRDRDLCYKVGNSVRSDVKPALAAGIKVIYIPFDTWSYEVDNDLDTNNVRLFVLNDIREMIGAYGGL